MSISSQLKRLLDLKTRKRRTKKKAKRRTPPREKNGEFKKK